MTGTEKTDNTVARAGEQMFQFAIDLGDMNTILDALPLESPEKRVALEYEIQLLRIISVGWAIAFFVAGSKMFSLTINTVRGYLDGAPTQQD